MTSAVRRDASIRRAAAVLVAVIALLALAAMAASVPGARAAATGVPCRSVHAGGYRATHVFVDFMRCRSARTKLRRWLGRGRLPRHPNGWDCYRLGGRVRECSYPGRDHPTRDFTFWLRHTG